MLTFGVKIFLRIKIVIIAWLLLTACQSNTIESKHENQQAPNDNIDAITPSKIISRDHQKIVSIKVNNLTEEIVKNQVITFGQIFKKGDFPNEKQLITFLKSQPENRLKSQIDIKASHSDKSVRHAIISIELPSLTPNTPTEIIIATSSVDNPNKLTNNIKANEYKADIRLNISGQEYKASFSNLSNKQTQTQWLEGPLVGNFITDIPIINDMGENHPHLHLQASIKSYHTTPLTNIDLILENNWSYEPSPTNIVYDISIHVCGKEVFSRSEITHYHHARWRKSFSCGTKPNIHIEHDSKYMALAGAIPNYDFKLAIPQQTLNNYKLSLSNTKFDILNIGLARKYMPATGAAPDIGPFPKWTSIYLISMSETAKKVSLATGNLAGSWSIHYRDKNTGLPVSLNDYPRMTLKGNYTDTRNRSTGNYEAFPACGGDCTSPYTADGAHQPSFSYIPYLVTGDYFHLEELHFWANYNLFRSNPAYRDSDKGLLKWSQVRDQAWSLRTLAHAAYITPDDHPLKKYFNTKLNNNIDWYTKTYVDKSKPLGIITNGYSIVYQDKRGIAPWQDDFFTWAVGHIFELGFQNIKPLLAWKATFPIARMTDTTFCWIKAAAYSLRIRPNKKLPLYSNIGEIYTENFSTLALLDCNSSEMANKLDLQIGEMEGYAHSPTGYPANMQIALSILVGKGIPGAEKAWDIFSSRNIQPNFESYPNFSLLPRK